MPQETCEELSKEELSFGCTGGVWVNRSFSFTRGTATHSWQQDASVIAIRCFTDARMRVLS